MFAGPGSTFEDENLELLQRPCHPTSNREPRTGRPFIMWYKDAIFYELHVKAFQDSNDDGVGDFRGLLDRLDYVQELGVDCIWLLPFYPSPLLDDGYDIADYYGVH